MTREQKIEYIAKHYGFENQCRQAVEEMAELTKEICKYQRVMSQKPINQTELSRTFYNLACEIADVEIMIQQLKCLTDTKVVELEIDGKLERQLKRIEEESTY